MTDMRKKWTKEQIEASKRRYMESRRGANGSKAVRVKELDLVFDSRAECAHYFKVSYTTISNALAAGGAFGDYTLEDVSEG